MCKGIYTRIGTSVRNLWKFIKICFFFIVSLDDKERSASCVMFKGNEQIGKSVRMLRVKLKKGYPIYQFRTKLGKGTRILLRHEKHCVEKAYQFSPKSVDFTEFLQKFCESKFLQFPHCVYNDIKQDLPAQKIGCDSSSLISLSGIWKSCAVSSYRIIASRR